MGSSRKPKSVRSKNARRGRRPLARKIARKASRRAPVVAPEIPPGLNDEIERQRDVLLTMVTLLHCLHVTLELRSTHRDEETDIEFDLRLKAAARAAYLPEMTALLLERAHAVLNALDSNNLSNALRAFKP